ncbi:MAG: hypothetical protein COA79_24120 [Planctomycetota bacterium]|nr:MAG: hypothetical protein COA79_24120 [Planctomycetota bacterium]
MIQANPEMKSLKDKYKSLPSRIFTSVIVLSILGVAIFLDISIFSYPWSISILAILISGLVVRELFMMAIECHHSPFIKWGIIMTSLLVACVPLGQISQMKKLPFDAQDLQIMVLIISALGCFWWQGQKSTTDKIFESVTTTLGGILYIGLLGSSLLYIAWFNQSLPKNITGIHLLGLTIITIKMTDIGAFMVGSAIGKHKWIPKISPGKSIEGLLGGMVISTGITWLINQYVWSIFDAHWKTVLFGIVLSFSGQLADLVESMFKRASKLKDSGNILPGFGGIFDLTDSLIAAAPISYFLLYILL